MEALRSCVKALKFCAMRVMGSYRTLLLHDGDNEYSLLLNLIRLYELQLSRQISIESLLDDLAVTSKNFRTIDDEVIGFLLLNMHLHVCWLHYIINFRTILEQSISSFISKHSALFELLESFLTTKSSEGLRASQLACRVVLFLQTSTELEALGVLSRLIYSPKVLEALWTPTKYSRYSAFRSRGDRFPIRIQQYQWSRFLAFISCRDRFSIRIQQYQWYRYSAFRSCGDRFSICIQQY